MFLMESSSMPNASRKVEYYVEFLSFLMYVSAFYDTVYDNSLIAAIYFWWLSFRGMGMCVVCTTYSEKIKLL